MFRKERILWENAFTMEILKSAMSTQRVVVNVLTPTLAVQKQTNMAYANGVVPLYMVRSHIAKHTVVTL